MGCSSTKDMTETQRNLLEEATIAYKKNDYKTAKEKYTKLLKLLEMKRNEQDKQKECYIKIARINEEEGNIKDAIHNYDKAKELGWVEKKDNNKNSKFSNINGNKNYFSGTFYINEFSDIDSIEDSEELCYHLLNYRDKDVRLYKYFQKIRKKMLDIFLENNNSKESELEEMALLAISDEEDVNHNEDFVIPIIELLSLKQSKNIIADDMPLLYISKFLERSGRTFNSDLLFKILKLLNDNLNTNSVSEEIKQVFAF